jgi:hypothetical protein
LSKNTAPGPKECHASERTDGCNDFSSEVFFLTDHKTDLFGTKNLSQWMKEHLIDNKR